jgi:hypothetical protein
MGRALAKPINRRRGNNDGYRFAPPILQSVSSPEIRFLHLRIGLRRRGLLEADRLQPGEVLTNSDQVKSTLLEGFGFAVGRLFE